MEVGFTKKSGFSFGQKDLRVQNYGVVVVGLEIVFMKNQFLKNQEVGEETKEEVKEISEDKNVGGERGEERDNSPTEHFDSVQGAGIQFLKEKGKPSLAT